MLCSFCSREKKISARGLCAACYQRWRKRGTTEYAKKRARSFCCATDCDRPVVSHGMCDTHRKRLDRHGHIEETRPDDWGAKHKHPLFHSWSWMRRRRSVAQMDVTWREDFLQFAMDVGKRPSDKHKIFAIRDGEPIGPDNFVWRRAIDVQGDNSDKKAHKARRARAYRAVNRELFRGYSLKKTYGMSLEEYETLHAKQNGKCAVCGKPEISTINGNTLSLAVDHCHKTQDIRGLLCLKCNRGLGLFKDSADLLRKAAKYLN